MRNILIIAISLMFSPLLIAQDINNWTEKEAKIWLQKKEWSNGWKIHPHSSVNILEFSMQYKINKDIWDAVFTFLANNNLSELPIGTYTVANGTCKATVSQYFPKDKEIGNIESHCKYIDLQYTISGKEFMGIAKDAKIEKTYNEKRDITFYHAEKIKYFKAEPTVFFLFFPNDIHQPSVNIHKKGAVVSKKIVFKIPYKTINP